MISEMHRFICVSRPQIEMLSFRHSCSLPVFVITFYYCRLIRMKAKDVGRIDTSFVRTDIQSIGAECAHRIDSRDRKRSLFLHGKRIENKLRRTAMARRR